MDEANLEMDFDHYLHFPSVHKEYTFFSGRTTTTGFRK